MQKLMDLYFNKWNEKEIEEPLFEAKQFTEYLKQCSNETLTANKIIKLEELANYAFAAYEQSGFYAGYNIACQVLQEMLGDTNEKE